MPRKLPKRPDPPYVTILEREPEYLKAIGTLSVEIVNLEVMLSYLLGAILRLHSKVADAMYFAPQAMGPRLAIIEGAAREALKERADYLRKVRRCVNQAREHANKRNDIMHHAWGVSTETGEITSRRLPFSDKQPQRPVPLSEIDDSIYGVRVLLGAIRELALSIGSDQTYWPSHKTLPEQVQGEILRASSLLKADPPTHELPPESSRE